MVDLRSDRMEVGLPFYCCFWFRGVGFLLGLKYDDSVQVRDLEERKEVKG